MIYGPFGDKSHDMKGMLQVAGRCAIMPNALLGHGADSISLIVGGDIQQYGGYVSALRIQAKNYILYDDFIQRPDEAPKGSCISIVLTEGFRHLGGRREQQPWVKIEDADIDRMGEERFQIKANEAGLTLDKGKL